MTRSNIYLVSIFVTLLSCKKSPPSPLSPQKQAVGSYRFDKIIARYWTIHPSGGHIVNVKRLPAATFDVVAIGSNSIKIKNYVVPYKTITTEWPAVSGKSLSNYSFSDVKAGAYYARVHLEEKGDSILLIYKNGGNPGHLPDTTYYGSRIR
ncbi:hypothetical protein [Hymenobacter radiodurans]|uniref:hypothetical protein n=1 Tax=Hymenobacter radiodurans TaxID=2496028 RepID=UPI0010584399|nr:hypothetical protein [Hymenobacter radiodurans]